MTGYFGSGHFSSAYYDAAYFGGPSAPVVPVTPTEGDVYHHKGHAVTRRRWGPKQYNAVRAFFEAELGE